MSIQHKGRVDKFGKWQEIKSEIIEIIKSTPQEYQRKILDKKGNLDFIGASEKGE